MDSPQLHTDDTLRQRFRDLTEQFSHIHQSWQEAYGQHDVARQLELIDREQALLAELGEIMGIFRQTLQQRLIPYKRPPERTP